MKTNVLKVANQYQLENIPYALALVVRREKPTSGKQGDKAIIMEDGNLIGWIGGGCTKPVVINEAKLALEEGTPRLIRISPNKVDPQPPGIKHYEMTCYSGGSVDVYIEPVLGKPELIILGRSAIAQSLARIGNRSNYKVSIFSRGEIPLDNDEIEISLNGYDLEDVKITNKTNLVISTQGENDEEAIQEALKTEAGYIGLVVSRKKWSKISSLLSNQGITEDQLQRVHAPAGLDINAKSPDEVAISILAQIIQVKRLVQQKEEVETVDEQYIEVDDNIAIDPICKMKVEMDNADYTGEYNNETFYFCCLHCKDTFLQNPEMYV